MWKKLGHPIEFHAFLYKDIHHMNHHMTYNTVSLFI